MKSQPVKPKPIRYVRLSSTVLFPVKSCYGGYREEAERCWLCGVRKQCASGQKTETR